MADRSLRASSASICLLPAGTSTPEFSVLLHRPEAIAQWAQELYQPLCGDGGT